MHSFPRLDIAAWWIPDNLRSGQQLMNGYQYVSDPCMRGASLGNRMGARRLFSRMRSLLQASTPSQMGISIVYRQNHLLTSRQGYIR